MTQEQENKLLDSLETVIDRKNKALSETVDKSVSERLTAELAEMQRKYVEATERLDKFEANSKRPAQRLTLKDHFHENLMKSKAFEAFRGGGANSAKVDLSDENLFRTKDMTTGNTYTGEVIPPDRREGIIYDPDRSVHVRQFLGQGTTISDLYRYVKETAIFNAGTLGITEEGETKTQVDFDLATADAPVKKIAIFMVVTDEMLEDTPGLSSYLSARFSRFIPIAEDAQFLYGSGVGLNFTGINQVAPGYTRTPTADDNLFDVLRYGITQAQTQTNNGRSGYNPNVVMISPTRFDDIAGLKDEDGRYLFPQALQSNVLRVKGIPIIPTTAVNADDFFIGDFAIGAMVLDRNQMSMQLSREDGTNFRDNKVTVRFEKRMAFPILRDSAFVYDNFTAATTLPT